MSQFPHTLFVTGTDADVGKTFISAVLTLGLDGIYWKPIQCGVSPCTDTEWVREATGLGPRHFLKETYRFGEPISPHAQHTGIEIQSLKHDTISIPNSHLIMEGLGGIMVPLNDREFYVDFIKSTSAPVLLVVPNTKGAVNQAILTMEKLHEKEIPIFGIVLNGPKDVLNRNAILQYCHPPRLFEMDFIPHITKNTLISAFEECFISANSGHYMSPSS